MGETMSERHINELNKIGINLVDMELIREKDRISIYRVVVEEQTLILKIIDNPKYLKEIILYKLFQKINLNTIQTYAMTDHCILMEDISTSKFLRLGKETDMTNPKIMYALGEWYKKLHTEGVDLINYLKTDPSFTNLSLELLNESNIKQLSSYLELEDNRFFEIMLGNLTNIRNKIFSFEETLCYQDFYYENLVVSKDESIAFMFDYNMINIGYVESDLNNALWFSDDKSKCAFFENYGYVSELKMNFFYLINKVITLIDETKKGKKAKYIDDIIRTIRDGEMLELLNEVLKTIDTI